MSGTPSSPANERPTAARPSTGERLAEYFTLRKAAAELERLDEVSRARIAESIALARQQMAAAEALFAVGHTVEALRLGAESIRETERAADRYAALLGLLPAEPAPEEKPDAKEPAPEEKPDAEKPDAAATTDAKPEGDAKPEADPKVEAEAAEAKLEASAAEAKPAPARVPGWRILADRAGLSVARIRDTERALADLETRVVPRLEKDVAPGHVDAFRELVRARIDIEEGVLPATLTKDGLTGTRVFRVVGTTALALVALVGSYFLLRPVEGTFVRASATWADSADFRSDFIIDGDDDTMWLVPNGQEGWIEVRVVPPIPEVHRVRLVNAGSTRVPDRGTHEYQLEIYAGGRLERTIDGAFDDELGGTATHDVNVRNVDRIRFVARSNYRVGSGLAELTWE